MTNYDIFHADNVVLERSMQCIWLVSQGTSYDHTDHYLIIEFFFKTKETVSYKGGKEHSYFRPRSHGEAKDYGREVDIP